MQIAIDIATRATCDRKHVGAVIVDANHRIISAGYNGSPAGMPHCDDVGHELKEIDGRMSCIRTLHAESNALDDAGRRAEGGTIYVTVTPCYDCAKRIIQHRIKRVVYGEHYQSRNTDLVHDLFRAAGVELVQFWGVVENREPQQAFGRCPNCGTIDAGGTTRERRPNGFTTCGACNIASSSSSWVQEMT